MFGRFVDWILLIGALAGLMLTAWWTVMAAPNNIASLQQQLQTHADIILRESRYDWASVKMVGQHAYVSGQAPDEESLEALIARLGGENLLMGPITKINIAGRSGTQISENLVLKDATDLHALKAEMSETPSRGDVRRIGLESTKEG